MKRLTWVTWSKPAEELETDVVVGWQGGDIVIRGVGFELPPWMLETVMHCLRREVPGLVVDAVNFGSRR